MIETCYHENVSSKADVVYNLVGGPPKIIKEDTYFIMYPPYLDMPTEVEKLRQALWFYDYSKIDQKMFDTVVRPAYIAWFGDGFNGKVRKDFMKYLIDLDKRGFYVALVGYTPDKNLCARSILAEALLNAGANVICN